MGWFEVAEKGLVKTFGRAARKPHLESGLERGVGHATPHEPPINLHPPEPTLHAEPSIPHHAPSIAREANAAAPHVTVNVKKPFTWVPTTRNVATGGVIGYGGVVAINTMQEMKHDAAVALGALPKELGDVMRHLGEVPKDSYEAFLRQMHELEAGISSGTGVGSAVTGLLTSTLGVVTLAGSLYMGLEFYRAYKS